MARKTSSRAPIADVERPKARADVPRDGFKSNGVAVDAPPQARADAPWSEDDARFWQVALVLLLVGIALRQALLANFPYSSDEAIHAWYAWGFNTYSYDPIYHGPLLYHLNAATFRLLGNNDYTARLVPSLLGVGLLAMAFGPARRHLGSRGALWTLGILAISPVMVTYSRRLIHDALVMVLTLGAILCFQTAREYPSHTPEGRSARVGLLLLLTLFVATKANAFFIIVMLLAFYVAEKMAALYRQRFGPRALNADARGRLADAPVAPVAPWFDERVWRWIPLLALGVVAVVSHFCSHPITPDGGKTYIEAPGYRLTGAVFRLTCVLACGMVWLWLLRMRPVPPAVDATQAPETVAPRGFDWQTPLIAISVSLLAFVYLFGHGSHWFREPSAFKLGLSEALAIGNLQVKEVTIADGALTKMIKYWGGQQAKPRLPGPHDYYIVMIALYELPIALAALAGLVRACRERTPFTDLLVWWSVTSFALYSLANEKVPWLLAHVMLPLALLAGWWLGRKSAELKAQWRPLFIGATALSTIFLARGAWACNFERAADHHEPMFYAQTTEMFRDVFFGAIEDTKSGPYEARAIWIDNTLGLASAQWPCAWYVRDHAVLRGPSDVLWGDNDAKRQLRLIVTSEEKWASDGPKYRGWKGQTVEFYIWPRASWPGLKPNLWWRFWSKREVNPLGPQFLIPGAPPENGILTGPGEWSSNKVVIATPPMGKQNQALVAPIKRK